MLNRLGETESKYRPRVLVSGYEHDGDMVTQDALQSRVGACRGRRVLAACGRVSLRTPNSRDQRNFLLFLINAFQEG